MILIGESVGRSDHLSDRGVKMNWNTQMEVHYNNISYPYSTAGSFIEYFEGLTYEHVNFIFNGASHAQESFYPSTTSFYKFGLSEHDSTSYYRESHGYEANHHEPQIDEYRRPAENSSTISDQTATASMEWGEGPRRHHNSHNYQVILQDNIDPDHMTYEVGLNLNVSGLSSLYTLQTVVQLQ